MCKWRYIIKAGLTTVSFHSETRAYLSAGLNSIVYQIICNFATWVRSILLDGRATHCPLVADAERAAFQDTRSTPVATLPISATVSYGTQASILFLPPIANTSQLPRTEHQFKQIFYFYLTKLNAKYIFIHANGCLFVTYNSIKREKFKYVLSINFEHYYALENRAYVYLCITTKTLNIVITNFIPFCFYPNNCSVPYLDQKFGTFK